MKISWSLKGADEISKRAAQWIKRYENATAAALYQEGLAIDAKAVAKTPVDSGRLRATHYVAPPVKDKGRMTVEIGFGTDYAVYVHERTEVGHPVGEAKFLEKALNERTSGFKERMAKRVRANLRSGVEMVPLDPNTPQRPTDPGPTASKAAERRKKLSAVKKSKRVLRRAKKAERKWAATQKRKARKAERRKKRQIRAAWKKRNRRK